jgi:hypothetical protein
MEVQLLAAKPACVPSTLRKQTRAQENGQQHEYRMHRRFEEEFGEFYLPSPWFRYYHRNSYRWKYCQPDGLLFRPKGLKIIICEAKLAHTSKAFGQLEVLYRPIIEAAFPSWRVYILEVVRWYRSDVLSGARYPVPVFLVHEPDEAELDKFNVMILNSRSLASGGGRYGKERSDAA